MTIERRFEGGIALQAEGDVRQWRGHASLFNDPYEVAGLYVEVFKPGAFANAVAGDVRALFNHDESQVLGRTKSGTLRLSEDARGLAVVIDPPASQLGHDVGHAIERGDVDQMSIGFIARRQTWIEPAGDGLPRRELLEVELIDVSVVTFPANANTDIALRSLTASRAGNVQNFLHGARRRLKLHEVQI